MLARLARLYRIRKMNRAIGVPLREAIRLEDAKMIEAVGVANKEFGRVIDGYIGDLERTGELRRMARQV